MGNCFQIQFGDQTIHRLWDWIWKLANNPRNLEKKLTNLEEAWGTLQTTRNDFQSTIKIAKKWKIQPLGNVKGWFRSVETMEGEVMELMSQREGLGKMKFDAKYELGEKIAQTIIKVNGLKDEGCFTSLVEKSPPDVVERRAITSPSEIVGQQSTFHLVWDYITSKEQVQVGRIGIYGAKGLGKKTLLTRINNEFDERKHQHGFDIIIWVSKSSNLNIQEMQDSIATRIGCKDATWSDGNKKPQEKTTWLYNALREIKFVLLLDDLGDWINLTELGVPTPDKDNGCKLVFTTCSKVVCGRMRAKKVEMPPLKWKDAWQLFQDTVGKDTLSSHPQIRELAEALALKCEGSPSALAQCGRAMADQTDPDEWRKVIQTINDSSLFPEAVARKREGFPLALAELVRASGEERKEIQAMNYRSAFPCQNSMAFPWLGTIGIVFAGAAASYGIFKHLKSRKEVDGENAITSAALSECP